MPTLTGFKDSPIDSKTDDSFRIGEYAEALSTFILECDTPMTIAIQGEWGSGKTSMMKMVKEALGDDIFPIWLNTWQFSQFNAGDTLSVTFLQSVVNELQDTSGIKSANSKAKEALTWIRHVVVFGASIVSESAAGEVSKTFDENNNIVKTVVNLRDNLQELIDTVCKKKECKRIVIFIDDLDRLPPGKALDVLEALKVFLDCEKCVFLLAIDTSVIYQGISEKYGSEFSDSKKQDYFDKIIQLPFIMPIGHYNLDSYIKRLLSGILFSDNKENNDIIGLIKLTSYGNPRGVKRILNAFIFANLVALKKQHYSEDMSYGSQAQKLLLIMQCMQLKFDELYTYILDKSYKKEIESIIKLDLGDSDPPPEPSDAENDLTEIISNHENPAGMKQVFSLFKQYSFNVSELSGIEKVYSIVNLSAQSHATISKGYNFDMISEYEGKRLRVQSGLLYKFDGEIYSRILKKYRNAVILDVGCNEGDTANERLQGCNYKQYVGVDISKKAIEEAKRKYASKKQSFYIFDLTRQEPSVLKKQTGIDKYDIIIVSMTLLHIDDQQGFITKLKDYLSESGRLLVMDVDDRRNIAEPDPDGLFEKCFDIIRRDKAAGNRHTGNEIEGYLKNAGYKNITQEKCGFSTDDWSMDEKLGFYDIYFGILLEDLKDANGDDTSAFCEDYQWCKENLPIIKERFCEPDFHFSSGLVFYSAGL